MAPAAPPRKRASGLPALVSRVANDLLDDSSEITPDKLATAVVEHHGREIKPEADKLLRTRVRSLARATLRRRADMPLQQEELPLGLPKEWLLAVRGDKGQLTYVLADEAEEDHLLGAEEERKHRVKLAEAAVANGQQAARRRLERATAELERYRTLVSRLNGGVKDA